MNKMNEQNKVSKKPGFVGEVISTDMAKTVKVRVSHLYRHPLYRKAVKRSKIFLAHTEESFTVGDKVKIVQTRPISKNKHFKIVGKV